MTSVMSTPVKLLIEKVVDKDFRQDFNYPIETNEKGATGIKKKVNIKKGNTENNNPKKILNFFVEKNN